jgi:ABC-type multidrug transport system fused ATPase/permease subunit
MPTWLRILIKTGKISNLDNPAGYYNERLGHFNQQIEITRKRLKWLALSRLAIFILTIILVIIATRWSISAIVAILAISLVVFILVVIQYLKLQKIQRKNENLAGINENELKALDGQYDMFDDGDEFSDPDHPFAGDLDVFGKLGLYQFINRSATIIGKQKLAGWLSDLLRDTDAIVLRQQAVEELSQKAGFRQEFQAIGKQSKEQPGDRDNLLAWISEPASLTGRPFFFFLFFIPLITIAVLILIISGIISPAWLILYFAVPFGFLGRYYKIISLKYRVLSGKAELMKKYSELFLLIENEEFNSGKLKEIKDTLDGKSGFPSRATKELSAILDAFDARNNIIAGFLLNFLFLWDLIQVVRTERWQAAYRDDLPRWLEALAEVDALSSLANFHFNHPGSIFPEIKNDDYLIDVQELGHPLISASHRVSNPAILLCRRHFTIVSGANMAGKSTYLRTVGVSLVLAMAGSAVLAESMSFRPAGLVSSIRTKDSLQKNESYFYAELKRLKGIIDKLEAGEKLVILLDEILKGTNSRDKQSGSVALLEKLLRYDACGFIATHDLALGDLEKTYPENITNKSFEVVIENDALAFDYKLKDGIARQMNATFLMKKMGITD